MNKRKILIISGAIILLLGFIGVFVFKVSGSNTSDYISGCTPYNIKIDKGEGDYQAVISWKTKENCTGFLIYGDHEDLLDRVAVDLEGGAKNRDHIVRLDSLVSSRRYFFSVISDSVNYGKSGQPISFTLNSL